MSDSGGGNFGMQSRQAADSESAGPAIAPGKGPTNRTDVLVAVAVIAALAVAVIVLATR